MIKSYLYAFVLNLFFTTELNLDYFFLYDPHFHRSLVQTVENDSRNTEVIISSNINHQEDVIKCLPEETVYELFWSFLELLISDKISFQNETYLLKIVLPNIDRKTQQTLKSMIQNQDYTEDNLTAMKFFLTELIDSNNWNLLKTPISSQGSNSFTIFSFLLNYAHVLFLSFSTVYLLLLINEKLMFNFNLKPLFTTVISFVKTCSIKVKSYPKILLIVIAAVLFVSSKLSIYSYDHSLSSLLTISEYIKQLPDYFQFVNLHVKYNLELHLAMYYMFILLYIVSLINMIVAIFNCHKQWSETTRPILPETNNNWINPEDEPTVVFKKTNTTVQTELKIVDQKDFKDDILAQDQIDSLFKNIESQPEESLIKNQVDETLISTRTRKISGASNISSISNFSLFSNGVGPFLSPAGSIGGRALYSTPFCRRLPLNIATPFSESTMLIENSQTRGTTVTTGDFEDEVD